MVWYDSSHLGGGWVYGEDIKAVPKEIESVGFICDVNPAAVMITCGRSPSGGVITPITIPVGAIKSYTILEL